LAPSLKDYRSYSPIEQFLLNLSLSFFGYDCLLLPMLPLEFFPLSVGSLPFPPLKIVLELVFFFLFFLIPLRN